MYGACMYISMCIFILQKSLTPVCQPHILCALKTTAENLFTHSYYHTNIIAQNRNHNAHLHMYICLLTYNI